jgi:hypothetical protein
MAGEYRLRRAYKEHVLRQKTDIHQAEDQQELIAHQPGIISLGQQIGNQAVQRLLTQGMVTPQGTLQTKPDIQRCAACKGREEEMPISAYAGDELHRAIELDEMEIPVEQEQSEHPMLLDEMDVPAVQSEHPTMQDEIGLPAVQSEHPVELDEMELPAVQSEHPTVLDEMEVPVEQEQSKQPTMLNEMEVPIW